MRIKVYENAEKLYGAAAETVAKLVRNEIERHAEYSSTEPKLNVCLSADGTNLGVLHELVSEDVSWKNVRLYSSWEFLNENSLSDISRRKKIDDALVSKLTTFDREKNGGFFEGEFTSSSIDRVNYGLDTGFDVLCLEIMPYGSLLMNLPLTNSYDCREIYRESEDILGSAVATVSPYGVLKSKHLVLAASGYKTAQWVAYMLKCEFSSKCPAAIVKEHGDFILLLDKEAASCVPQCYLG